MSKRPALPQVVAQREISAETQSQPWPDGQACGNLHILLAITLDWFPAADTGRDDRIVQFLAGDRLVQNAMTADGGFLDARRRGIAGHDNGRDRTADMDAESLDCIQARGTIPKAVVGDDHVDRCIPSH